MKYCPKCKNPCEDSDMFCQYCGEFLGDISIEEAINAAIEKGDMDPAEEILIEVYGSADYDRTVRTRRPEGNTARYRDEVIELDRYRKPDHRTVRRFNLEESPVECVYDGRTGTASRQAAPDAYEEYNDGVYEDGAFDEYEEYDEYDEYEEYEEYDEEYEEEYDSEGADAEYLDELQEGLNQAIKEEQGKETASYDVPEKKKSKKGLLITLIIVVLVLGAAGYMVIFQNALNSFVSAERVTLKNSFINLGTGEEVKLSAAVEPFYAGQKMIWNSDNPAVAAVDGNGKVTGVSRGSATITAQSFDGKAAAYCTFIVTFPDVVQLEQKYIDAINWADNAGLSGGLKDGRFGAENECTRKQYALMLYRLAGTPEVSGTLDFPDCEDLKETDAAYKAILWASKEGIVGGIDGMFKPDASITKQQAMIMLYRFAGKPGVSGELTYTDIDAEPGSVGYKAALWASKMGLTEGTDDGVHFVPSGKCLRKDAVLFLYRYTFVK